MDNSQSRQSISDSPQQSIPEISTGRVSGVALLRIIKPCEDRMKDSTNSMNQIAKGALLGLYKEEESILEIAYSIPTFSEDDPEYSRAEEEIHTKDSLLTHGELKIDENPVGWYRTMQFGNFGTKELCSGCYSWQQKLNKAAIVLLYDPIQSHNGGHLSVEAYRVTPEYDQLINNPQKKLPQTNLLQKLNVEIINPGLMTSLLWKMQDCSKINPLKSSISFDIAKSAPFIEKKLNVLANEVDSLSTNLERFKRHYFSKAIDTRQDRRGRRGGKDDNDDRDDVDRIGTLLSTQQISSFCDQINQFCKENNDKLLVAESFHKKTTKSSTIEGK